MIRIVDKEGKACPTIFCDYCGKTITDARDGNYQWEAQGRGDIFFTHKQCCRAFEESRTEPGKLWCSMELQCLPIYLGENLELDWRDVRETARFMAQV